MGTFGGGTFGGPGGGSGSGAGVALSTILYPMLRMAGITVLPGTTPSDDQVTELIPMVNRMLGSWNLDGHKIYNSAVNQFTLVNGQKTYTIGPGGEMDMARPLYIKYANVLFPTTPVVRQQVYIYSDEEWASISIQDLTGAPPFGLYYDNSLDADGLATLSLIFQPPAGYTLEIYTWQALQSSFASVSDIAQFPPGYEEALVLNGALRVVALNPHESKLDGAQRAELKDLAAKALRAVRTLNTRAPVIGCDPSLTSGGNDGNGRPWIAGIFG